MIRIDTLDGKHRTCEGTVEEFNKILLATLLNGSVGLPTVIMFGGLLLPFDKIVCVAPCEDENNKTDPKQRSFEWVKK